MKNLINLVRGRGTSITEAQESENLNALDLEAMNFLRSGMIDPEVSSGFEDRVLRKHRLQVQRSLIGYWAPAAVAAGIAALAFFAVLQMLTAEPSAPGFIGQEARLVNERTVFPSPHFDSAPAPR